MCQSQLLCEAALFEHRRACRRAETTPISTTWPAARQACDSGVAVARHAGAQRDELRPSNRVKYMLDCRARSGLVQAARTTSPPANPLGSVRRGGKLSGVARGSRLVFLK